jgi:hypothetical protein
VLTKDEALEEAVKSLRFADKLCEYGGSYEGAKGHGLKAIAQAKAADVWLRLAQEIDSNAGKQ